MVAVLVGLLGAGPAAADEEPPDRVAVVAAVRYLVLADRGEVQVSARVTVRNTDVRVDRELQSVALVLPDSAGLDVSASRAGDPLAVTAGDVSGTARPFVIDIGRPVPSGGEAEFDLRYVQRQTDSDREPSPIRINEAYVSVVVGGIGDVGAGSVRIEWPAVFPGRLVGRDATPDDIGLARRIEIPDAGSEFSAVFEMRNDAALERTAVEIPGTAAGVELASWPGDVGWRSSVGEDVAALIPALAEAIGAPWPLDEVAVVRESNVAAVDGYEGSFVRRGEGGAEIEVGSVFDDRLLAHELAHAWFGDDLAPWLAEGLAEEFARQVVGRTGFGAVDVDDADALPLDVWRPLAGADVADSYAYAASSGLFRSLHTEIGEQAFRDVVADLLSGSSPYGEDIPLVEGLADWQRVLDGFAAAGSRDVEDLLVTWVLSTPPLEVLVDRSSAVAALEDFESRSDGWAVPLAIRLAMARWDFPRAEAAIVLASDLLDERDRQILEADRLGVAVPSTAADAYAADPTTASAALQAQATGLDALVRSVDARDANRSLLARVGLWGTDVDDEVAAVGAAFEAGDHEVAVRLADGLEATIDDAGTVGTRRAAAALAGLCLLALVWLAIFVRRARRHVIAR